MGSWEGEVGRIVHLLPLHCFAQQCKFHLCPGDVIQMPRRPSKALYVSGSGASLGPAAGGAKTGQKSAVSRNGTAERCGSARSSMGRERSTNLESREGYT